MVQLSYPYMTTRKAIALTWQTIVGKVMSLLSSMLSRFVIAFLPRGWVPKNWGFWIVVLEKTLESPLDCKEIKAVHPKWNQARIIIGRTDAETETPILWPPDENWLIGKDLDAGKDWRQEGKGTREDEIVRWHHWLDGHEFEQALEVGDGQGSLVCCSPWGHKQLDMTEWLNWTEMIAPLFCITEGN